MILYFLFLFVRVWCAVVFLLLSLLVLVLFFSEAVVVLSMCVVVM